MLSCLFYLLLLVVWLFGCLGSEKWNIMHRMREDHITEMTNINLSLHTLGRCISSLAQKAKGRDGHVPYR